jgi:hypothetical protein
VKTYGSPGRKINHLRRNRAPVVKVGLAYVVRDAGGTYDPFVFRSGLKESDVEVADDVFVIRKEDAEAYVERQEAGRTVPPEPASTGTAGSARNPIRDFGQNAVSRSGQTPGFSHPLMAVPRLWSFASKSCTKVGEAGSALVPPRLPTCSLAAV